MKVGDKVLIINAKSCGFGTNDDMERSIGKIFTVKSITGDCIKVEENYWSWHKDNFGTPGTTIYPLINLTDTYVNSDGDFVKVYCINAPGKYPVHARVDYSDGTGSTTLELTATGHDSTWEMESGDAPEIFKLSFEIDDKVLVQDKGDSKWKSRHYAGFVDGKHECYNNGRSSHTNEGQSTVSWDFIKKA